MKVLLVSPPTNSVIKSIIGVTGPPLGLAYLASVARKKENEVKIIDSLALDLTFNKLKGMIHEFDPDLVGITATTSMIPDSYIVARIVKENNPNTKVSIGGPHVTFVPELTLQESKSIDFVIRGEGENVFENLLDSLRKDGDPKEVKGITYRIGDKIATNPPEGLIKNVDDIPMPALDLLPMDKYLADHKRFATIMTSRGCPYNCIFCSSSLQFGKAWRGHSVDRVLEELKRLVYEYRVNEIEFLDDTFTLNMARAIDVSRMIRKEGLDIRWSGSARVNLFNDEIAKAMKDAGAHTIYFGIESGSQKTLDFMGKGIKLEQSIDSIKKGNKAGLNTLGSFIIGFPDDTTDDVKNTIRFSKKVGVKMAQFTVATPYPGTRLWDYAMKNDLILNTSWEKYTTLSPVMKLNNFTQKSILTWLGRAYASFYLRPSYLVRDIVKNKAFVFKRIIPFYSKAMLLMGNKKSETSSSSSPEQ